MKNIAASLFFMACFFVVDAQEVAQRIVVEHFTNTRCGICASRNPAFITNLESHPDIYHLSVHPSSPYSNCFLHLHNATENDDRTNFYSIYGGTPRLVIQGNTISASTNYGSATIFDDYEAQTTPISLNVLQSKVDNELIINLVVKAEANNSVGEATLFLAAVEQLVNYSAPNGEMQHHNVFRKTLNGNANGETISVPALAGDSLVISYTVASDSDWDFSEIYAMAILQDATDKSVIQVDASDPTDNVVLVNAREVNTIAASIFPNPVQEKLTIQLPGMDMANASLFNAQGVLVKKQTFSGQIVLDLNQLSAGVYLLHVETEEGIAVRKIIRSK